VITALFGPDVLMKHYRPHVEHAAGQVDLEDHVDPTITDEQAVALFGRVIMNVVSARFVQIPAPDLEVVVPPTAETTIPFDPTLPPAVLSPVSEEVRIEPSKEVNPAPMMESIAKEPQPHTLFGNTPAPPAPPSFNPVDTTLPPTPPAPPLFGSFSPEPPVSPPQST
jgi:hypothetical protein